MPWYTVSPPSPYQPPILPQYWCSSKCVQVVEICMNSFRSSNETNRINCNFASIPYYADQVYTKSHYTIWMFASKFIRRDMNVVNIYVKINQNTLSLDVSTTYESINASSTYTCKIRPTACSCFLSDMFIFNFILFI